MEVVKSLYNNSMLWIFLSIWNNQIPFKTDIHYGFYVFYLQSVPVSILENQQLAKMTLEYRRECEQSHVLQSLTSLEKNGGDSIDPNSAPSYSCTSVPSLSTCKHLLRLQENGAEILRGRTEWKTKKPNPHSNWISLFVIPWLYFHFNCKLFSFISNFVIRALLCTFGRGCPAIE